MARRSHQGQAAGTRWDTGQYLKFADERMRPALELLGRIPCEAPGVVYDLGCGSGDVTRLLAERWPEARVYGIDHSKEMLEKAAAEPGRVAWVERDISGWSPGEPAGVIYSNAALHWVEEHEALFPRLAGFLEPGGCLAVQMPLSWEAPSHRLMRETLANGGPGGRALGDESLRQAMGRAWVLPTQAYYELLAGRARQVDIWESEYLHILEGEEAVLEWVKGTGLRPILNGLGGAERELFLAEYTRRLRGAYPVRANGRTLYPFRRLFIVATV